MKKLINDPPTTSTRRSTGCARRSPATAGPGAATASLRAPTGPVAGKVGVVTGGGFGHLPVFAGYVGDGMLDACAVGNVFAGPPVDICAEAHARRRRQGGRGVRARQLRRRPHELRAGVRRVRGRRRQDRRRSSSPTTSPARRPPSARKRRGVAGHDVRVQGRRRERRARRRARRRSRDRDARGRTTRARSASRCRRA